MVWPTLRIKKYHVSLPQTSCTTILRDVTAFSEVKHTSQKFNVAHSMCSHNSEHKVTWYDHNSVMWLVFNIRPKLFVQLVRLSSSCANGRNLRHLQL